MNAFRMIIVGIGTGLLWSGNRFTQGFAIGMLVMGIILNLEDK